MPETLFIADLHLDPEKPIIITLFLKFLTERARFAKALYILGDLFEIWVGDDENDPIYQSILTALRTLTDHGVPVFVMRGNRDFFLGEGFAETTGCQLIDDPTVITVNGTPTLLMHGDTLCSLDLDYQAFRRQVRNPQWQQQFLAQSLEQRRVLAQQARQHSKIQTATYDESKMDVTRESVDYVLAEYKVYHLIHGHTHKPAAHTFIKQGQLAHRYVLGDWHENSVIILSCMANNWRLCDLAEWGSN